MLKVISFQVSLDRSDILDIKEKIMLIAQAESIAENMRKRAEIRRNIVTRKSVLEGKPDRIADLCEQGADIIHRLISELTKSNID